MLMPPGKNPSGIIGYILSQNLTSRPTAAPPLVVGRWSLVGTSARKPAITGELLF